MASYINYGFTKDANLQLKDDGILAASAIWQVSGSNKLIDVGDSTYFGFVNVDVSAIETGTGDELYTLVLQGGLRDATSTPDDPVIASGSLTNLVNLQLGAAAAKFGSAGVTDGIGRYFMFFHNVQGGIVYPILQGYLKVAGTVATGIDFTAYIGKTGF